LRNYCRLYFTWPVADFGPSTNCSKGTPPVTLAEFTLNGHGGLSFYDVSIVDGFNIAMAIVMAANGVAELQNVPGSKTNPSCVASLSTFDEHFKPYNDNQKFLGTSGDNPLPFVDGLSPSDVSRWCPWDLQVDPPHKPGDGVYAYPDDNIQRPVFQACFSACAKYNDPRDCCAGAYNDPSKCKPSLYSKNAKRVCPDAYTFGKCIWRAKFTVLIAVVAYDDQDSTFTTKSGAAFEVVFCPPGKSTKILATSGSNALSGKLTVLFTTLSVFTDIAS